MKRNKYSDRSKRVDRALFVGVLVTSTAAIMGFSINVVGEQSSLHLTAEDIGRIALLTAVVLGQLRVYSLVKAHRQSVNKTHDELINGVAELLASDRRNTTTMLLKVEEGIRAEVRAASEAAPPVPGPGGVVIPFPKAGEDAL